jgi:alkylation response protein AidB-like acyl-CoA dehydrogenase
MIVTRSDPQAAKHAGITYFIVDMKSPGIEIRPIVQMNGTAGFSEVFFSDVRVPDSNRIGEVNDGWRCALTTLMNERAALGGSGQAGLGIDDLIRLAQDTELNGRPAIEDRSVRQRLADFYVKSQGLDYTRYRTLTALSKGQTPGPENSLGKMVRAPLRQQMMHFAVELLGSSGAAMDAEFSPAGGGFQHAYLTAPGGRLAGGTDEILHNIIAERVLRLPPEARMDKGVPFKDIPGGGDR